MNFLRYIFIVTILIVFNLCPPIYAAKHLIVIYDVSSSMYRLNVATGASTRMRPNDIQRVNDYLTNLLFTNVSQSLRDSADSHIKKCDAAYVGQPLYQSGDIITYAEYAKRRYTKMNKQKIRRDEFHRRLPNPMDLRNSFFGQVSYLLRAEVEVYDELYNSNDDETYWIFVTDGDVDRSAESDPNISDVLQRHAIIEDKYDDPMIVGILVNGHVRIEVRRIQLISEAMFIANAAAPNKSVEEIQLRKDKSGQFYSEPLFINTKVSNKTKYKLNSVSVEIFDKNGNPLQIVDDDNGTGAIKLAPVLLHGKVPPAKFEIPLPVNTEITDSGKLTLKVNYSFNGKDGTHSIYTDYEPVDSSVYISNLDNPNDQVEKVVLRLSEGSYRAPLVIRSQNPNKTAFRIDKISARILYDDNDQLCDVDVSISPTNLDKQFEIVVPKVKDLKNYGNKLVLTINYHYKETAESETIETLFDPRIDSTGALRVILIVIGSIALIIGTVFLISRILKLIKSDATHKIKLQADGKEARTFTLNNETAISFGQAGDSEYSFDVGSSARISCHKGKILFHNDLYDEQGRELTTNQTLELQKSDGEQLEIHFEFVRTDPGQPQGTDLTNDGSYDDDDLLPP